MRSIRRSISCSIPGLLAAALAAPALIVSPALAAPAPQAPARQQADPSNVPEPGNPEAARRALNAQEASAAQNQLDRNAASEAHYDAALALNDMKAKRDAAAYGDVLDAHASAEYTYRATRQQWETKNPACWNGDAAKCPADPEAPAP